METGVVIKNLVINGEVEEVGDCVQNNPGVVIRDTYGNRICLSLSEDEAKYFGQSLYKRVHIIFDANIFITKE